MGPPDPLVATLPEDTGHGILNVGRISLATGLSYPNVAIVPGASGHQDFPAAMLLGYTSLSQFLMSPFTWELAASSASSTLRQGTWFTAFTFLASTRVFGFDRHGSLFPLPAHSIAPDVAATG